MNYKNAMEILRDAEVVKYVNMVDNNWETMSSDMQNSFLAVTAVGQAQGYMHGLVSGIRAMFVASVIGVVVVNATKMIVAKKLENDQNPNVTKK